MTTYAFRPVANFQQIIKSHEARGFRVLVSGVHWDAVVALAKSMGKVPSKDDTLVLSSLARKLHEHQKSGQSFFGQPTLVVLDDSESPDQQATAWQHIQQAAEQAESEVVFAYTPATCYAG